MFVSLLGVALTSVLVGLPAVAKADLIQNGSFSTGNFNYWTVNYGTGGSSSTLYVATPSPTNGLNSAAYFELAGDTYDNGNNVDQIYQSFATTPGQKYTVNFEYVSQTTTGSSPENYFSADIGTTLTSLRNLTGVHDSTGSGLWTSYTHTFDATSSSYTLSFSGAGGFEVDAIGVNADPTPEPATILLVGVGLLGLAVLGRKLHS